MGGGQVDDDLVGVRGVVEQAAQRRVEDLRTQLERAEDFAATLRDRLDSARGPGSATAR